MFFGEQLGTAPDFSYYCSSKSNIPFIMNRFCPASGSIFLNMSDGYCSTEWPQRTIIRVQSRTLNAVFLGKDSSDAAGLSKHSVIDSIVGQTSITQEMHLLSWPTWWQCKTANIRNVLQIVYYYKLPRIGPGPWLSPQHGPGPSWTWAREVAPSQSPICCPVTVPFSDLFFNYNHWWWRLKCF